MMETRDDKHQTRFFLNQLPGNHSHPVSPPVQAGMHAISYLSMQASSWSAWNCVVFAYPVHASALLWSIGIEFLAVLFSCKTQEASTAQEVKGQGQAWVHVFSGSLIGTPSRDIFPSPIYRVRKNLAIATRLAYPGFPLTSWAAEIQAQRD
ncbi:hypothetical protein TRIATDRAFT_302201 [Trichoderma atroviride IMI 206040]|uniref:Uncharacterized protein n=1 Tax=Hypocrea atroviridis (strain ATCC 20476 / IMI 206040) TaxID=452589 RepID=G9P8T9_HYPAI|nr:uncharacterized protein TRIATDRAFT_302201 [Trichoderma atroviride IMI 206040]EHK41811.1 hypothetical protein TRIATDRAFT_302201 [Trichoderma atroviride IMI 206040]